MKKAFILIDYSYDFIADQGALTTGQPGQALGAGYFKLLSGICRQWRLLSDCHGRSF